LTCRVSPVTNAQLTVQWRFRDGRIDGGTNPLINGVTTYTINDFQPSHDGDYSCVVTTEYWSVSSANMYVRIAGMSTFIEFACDSPKFPSTV